MFKSLWKLSQETGFRVKCFQSLGVLTGLGLIYDVLAWWILDKPYMLNLLLPVMIFFVIGAVKLKSWCRTFALFSTWSVIIGGALVSMLLFFQDGSESPYWGILLAAGAWIIRSVLNSESFMAEFSEDGRALKADEKQWLLVLSLFVSLSWGSSLYQEYRLNTIVENLYDLKVDVKAFDAKTKKALGTAVALQSKEADSLEKKLTSRNEHRSSSRNGFIELEVKDYEPRSIIVSASGYEAKELTIDGDTEDLVVYLTKKPTAEELLK